MIYFTQQPVAGLVHYNITPGLRSNHGPENHYTVYKTQHLALTTIITCSTRFSSVKFCHHGHIFCGWIGTLQYNIRPNRNGVNIGE